MKTDRRDLRDWFIITVIILIGFLCLIVAGSMAIRFSPSWKLSADMDSHLDPNSDYLTRRPQGYIEPVDQSILTPPLWIGFFQTPGATVPQRTALPTQTAAPTSTQAIVPTATIQSTVPVIPTNTIVYYPASPTNTQRSAPPPTFTNTSTVNADLQITKTDGLLMYSAGKILTYTIIATNNGPANVIGAVITDNLPAQIENWTWDCTSQNGGASGCDAVGSNKADFGDMVDLPSGASIEYTVTAQVLTSASGDLVNTAVLDVPPTNTESDPSNNSASDTDQFLPASTLPTGNIGETKDGLTDVVSPGNTITLVFSTPLVVNGHAGYDLVYYERPNLAGIAMDVVALAISDGINWYTIFYWGDNMADTNSNMDISVLGGSETDNRDFTSPPPGLLYNGTGIAMELDGVVPPGTYPYIRFISPPAPGYPDGVNLDGGIEVDAITILP
jgi:uncharacterized repeat protein (TIGR01451 family)